MVKFFFKDGTYIKGKQGGASVFMICTEGHGWAISDYAEDLSEAAVCTGQCFAYTEKGVAHPVLARTWKGGWDEKAQVEVEQPLSVSSGKVKC